MLAVILFHADVPGFAGGYVGVDVFFVISGYLITLVLLGPSERGVREQLRIFYVRRCRRILPALIAMLLVTTLFAVWLFLPNQLQRYGRDLGFTSALIGNFAIWRDGSYFDLAAPFSPLFHLWSIAVEEQFYLVFPLLLLASGVALAGRRRALFAGAAAASFALCVWASYYAPAANFFLAPTRAWQLLLGCIVALGFGQRLDEHRARGALAVAALLAILVCVTWYDDRTRYPGLYAVIPCVSAAILLATARNSPTLVGRWLSVKPLVFTGLISYSLYLWHLPVLAFAGYYNIRPLSAWQLAGLLLSIYLVSAVSWRYVEAPTRGRKWLRSDSRFLAAIGAATVVLGLLGLFLWHSGGLPGRLDEAEAKLIDTSTRLRRDGEDCALRPLGAIAAGSLCSFGPSGAARADVVVWGDSHAIVLLPEYERIATARNVRVHAALHSACRPLLDAASVEESAVRRRQCAEFNRAAASAIGVIDPKLVILNAHWLYPDLEIALTDGSNSAGGASAFELAFERTLRAIGPDRRICVIGAVPTLDYAMPYAYAVARRRGIDPSFIGEQTPEVELQQRKLAGYLEELQRRHAFTLVSPRAQLCSGSTCAVVTADGRSLYRDDNHLSTAGAELVGRSLEECFVGVE